MSSGQTYIELGDGTVVSPTNPMPIAAAGNVYNSQVTVKDGTLANLLAVDADGRIHTGAGATFNHGQAATGTNGAATSVIGANTHRSKVTITNISGHTVFIGHTSGVLITSGHAIPSGLSADFPTTSALFVVSSATGDAVTYAEFAA